MTSSRKKKGGLASIFGKWPGDETDEQLAEAMQPQPPPPMTEEQIDENFDRATSFGWEKPAPQPFPQKPSNRALEYVKNLQGNPWNGPLNFLPPNHMSTESCHEKIALAVENYYRQELEFIEEATTCPWTRQMIATLLKGETIEDLEKQLAGGLKEHEETKSNRKTKRR